MFVPDLIIFRFTEVISELVHEGRPEVMDVCVGTA
jgi:hypothetical protein